MSVIPAPIPPLFKQVKSYRRLAPIKDLRKLLKEGRLGGLSKDVYEGEPRLANYLRGMKIKKDETVKIIIELKNQDNVIFTPHNAFNTAAALERKAFLTVKSVINFLKHQRFPRPIPAE